jgi:hypothetical protein
LPPDDITSDLSRLWLLMTLAESEAVGAPGREPIREQQVALGTRPDGIVDGKAPSVARSADLLPGSSSPFVLAHSLGGVE